MLQNAARSSCELANPAQMRQIASQTGVLLRQMRFVAGRGAVAELLLAWLSWKAGLAGKQAGPESGLGRKAGWAGSESWQGWAGKQAGPESWLGQKAGRAAIG